MPKKSDRKEHESAMSSLLPEVSLDEESEEEEEQQQRNSSTDQENSSAVDEKNFSSKDTSSTDAASDGGEHAPDVSQDQLGLEVLPKKRPDLDRKLGPYVSEDVNEALEEAYLLLRRQLGGGASKSLIVEAALRFVLVDCLRRKENSEVGRWLQRVLESEE